MRRLSSNTSFSCVDKIERKREFLELEWMRGRTLEPSFSRSQDLVKRSVVGTRKHSNLFFKLPSNDYVQREP